MSFDGYHVGGMSIKTWAYSTLLVGFHLSLGVCEAKCIQGSFKNHVTDNLLMDYLYRIKNFQHPFEQTKPEYTALSIFNMLCLSWLENKDYYDTGNNESSEDSETKEESREKLMHSYRIILSLYLGNETRNRSTVEQHCRKHACNFSYSTKDLSPKDLQSMYYETCHWNGTFPACPSPQDTSSSTVQASTVTTTPVTAYQSTTVPSSTTSHQSINPSTPTSSSTTSYQSISASASPFQVSQMTDSPVPNDPMTSTPFSTTNHQSIIDNGKTCPRMGEVEALKSKNLVFTFLFIVSGLANVVLMIIVWSQCRGRRQYPQERTEVPRPGDLAELVILNGNVDLQ
ncbi:putative protein TPRXL isoform X4 [Colossoma macropomum]|uniref:putative protein TPRXL isoform X4 n=1 Tax=Colossoma macropomum TaxID=42526 RepID=UPI001864EB9E|nr:putative protein TPRXL isoform X4 [Colossoma macropomum]